jgi:glutaredoxin
MSGNILIYGKDDCPYTTEAKKEFARQKVPYHYYDVKKNKDAFEKMLKLTGGAHMVPVIVNSGSITIGFGGT